MQIAVGRFFFFGLLSIFFLFTNKRSLLKSHLPWRRALIFSLLSTIIPYAGLVLCLRHANPPVTALLFGLAPITISFFGNPKNFGSFWIPGLLTFSGLIFTNLGAFQFSSSSPGMYLIGLLCGGVGLAGWTWYAVANSKWTKESRQISSHEWVTMFGAMTFCIVNGIILSSLPFASEPKLLTVRFLFGSALLGIVSTYAAFLLWNIGSKRLSIHLAGQLAIFEMLFALFFIYLIERRWPHVFEIMGIILILTAVFLVLNKEKARASILKQAEESGI